MDGIPGIARLLRDPDVHARIRSLGTGPVHDAEDAVAELLACVPEQAHPPLGAKLPILDHEPPRADVLPAVEALAVKQRPPFRGTTFLRRLREGRCTAGKCQTHDRCDVPSSTSHHGSLASMGWARSCPSVTRRDGVINGRCGSRTPTTRPPNPAPWDAD